jgi:hypothetical protein
VKLWESSTDDIHDGFADLLKELEKGFSMGFRLFPELERHMAREMQRIRETDPSSSTSRGYRDDRLMVGKIVRIGLLGCTCMANKQDWLDAGMRKICYRGLLSTSAVLAVQGS